MKKILLKKIVWHLIAIELISVLSIAFFLHFQSKKAVYASMEQMLQQEEKLYRESWNILSGKSSDYEEGFTAGALLRMPTTNDNVLFVVDGTTGEILGEIDENLLQGMTIADNTEEFLDCIKNASEGRIIWKDHTPVFIKTKMVEDIILVNMHVADTQMRQAIWIVLGVILILTIIVNTVVVIVERYFQRYVFNEISMIEQTIERLIDGDESVTFHTESQTEMATIVSALNNWNNNIRHATKRMNWVINEISPDAALFECLSYVNSIYCSDNLPTLLGMDGVWWKELHDNADKFKEYLSGLDATKDEKGIVEVHDKFLRIEVYKVEQDYFGIIIDKTEEIRNQKAQVSALQRAVDASETDSLSGLMNRRGFENHVRQTLTEKTGPTVMLMIDVDNFKRVNDTMGHPEGDKVLRKIADLLKQQFRKDDVIGRIGGDEFAVFLYEGITQDNLEMKLNGVLAAVREGLTEYSRFDISISIGAVYVEEKKVGYEELYQCADNTLYSVKQMGKDRYLIERD